MGFILFYYYYYCFRGRGVEFGVLSHPLTPQFYIKLILKINLINLIFSFLFLMFIYIYIYIIFQ